MTDTAFMQRVLTVIGLVITVALILLLLWVAANIFLLLFAAILLAVLLRAPTNWMVQHTRLPEAMAVVLAIIPLLILLGSLGYLFAVPVGEQVAQLAETLPRAMQRFREWAGQYYWTRPLAALVHDLQDAKLDIQWLGRATGMISSTFQSVGSVLVVIFMGIYMAAQPRIYQRGFVRLLPRAARPRIREVLDEIGTTLRRWLVGRFITMTVVGSAAGIGLWWLDIPLAFTLGILTGLLEFIPYIGPILAAIPAILIAFNIDPFQAFYVLLLFIVIQSAENYLLSPLVEQRTVALPPALVIFSTLLLATFFGALGVIIASPLTATCIVAVRLLYVEDVVEQAAPR